MWQDDDVLASCTPTIDLRPLKLCSSANENNAQIAANARIWKRGVACDWKQWCAVCKCAQWVWCPTLCKSTSSGTWTTAVATLIREVHAWWLRFHHAFEKLWCSVQESVSDRISFPHLSLSESTPTNCWNCPSSFIKKNVFDLLWTTCDSIPTFHRVVRAVLAHLHQLLAAAALLQSFSASHSSTACPPRLAPLSRTANASPTISSSLHISS